MKKIVFTLAALMSMTFAFAEEASSSKANAEVAAEAQKYQMNISTTSLARALNLGYDEVDAVSCISDSFASDLKKAGKAQGADRDRLFKQAIKRNLAYMHAVLSHEQYSKYLELLNTTLNNRGVEQAR